LELIKQQASAFNIAIASYYTSSQIDSKLSALIGSAPAVLDTIQELATALNNDSNYATTISAALAGKQSLVPATNRLMPAVWEMETYQIQFFHI